MVPSLRRAGPAVVALSRCHSMIRHGYTASAQRQHVMPSFQLAAGLPRNACAGSARQTPKCVAGQHFAQRPRTTWKIAQPVR